ncbi:flavin monoamine oxidase family protein [Kordia sp.]|uniref:flavin monoamine oxidase family protein n=1 Tax=Kordia sp. TaxID=1965332 RepID=UPI003B5C9E9B
MTQKKATYIIIGAGLSGLTSAYALYKQGKTDILILEARERIGGRILTKNHIDLGATWFQNHHEYLSSLLDDLQIERFHQYSQGKSVLVYNSMAPAHYFENDPSYPSAFRIAGGSSAMIEKLAAIHKEKIHTNTVVSNITTTKGQVTILTNNGTYEAAKVIVTIPPRIATQITFTPELPETLMEAMENTHTWMSNAMKVGVTFANPFWRKKGFSGTLIGQISCVTELYDHCSVNEENYTLMGFVNEALRDVSAEERKTKILAHLKKYLGDEVMNYLSYEEKDWSQDSYTASSNIKSIYMSPRYGNSKFQEFYHDGRLLFSGAETSPIHGGYMDGAVFSGLNAAKKLIL